jgi:hypothetical protein
MQASLDEIKIEFLSTNRIMGALEYWSDGVLGMKGGLLSIHF